MGGTDDPSNLIEVSVEEHANLHLSLYLEHGKYEDWIAWQAISGVIGKEEIISMRCKLGARHPNVHSPEARRKRGLKSVGRKRKPLTDEQKKRISEGTKRAMNNEVTREKCRQHAIKQNQFRGEDGKFKSR